MATFMTFYDDIPCLVYFVPTAAVLLMAHQEVATSAGDLELGGAKDVWFSKEPCVLIRCLP